MPFRFLFRNRGEFRFQEGTYFDQESNAEKACAENLKKYPNQIFGYIEIDDPNGGA